MAGKGGIIFLGRSNIQLAAASHPRLPRNRLLLFLPQSAMLARISQDVGDGGHLATNANGCDSPRHTSARIIEEMVPQMI